MNGVCCGRLLDNRDKVLDHIEVKCKERRLVPRLHQNPCSEEELHEKIEIFKGLFFWLDITYGLF